MQSQTATQVHRQCRRQSRVASVHFTLPDGHVRVARRGVARSLANASGGVIGRRWSLFSGKMALPGTERTMRTRTKKAEEDEEVTSLISSEAMAEYSAHMPFVWNVEQPARVRRGGGFAPENGRQLADQTGETDCLCLTFVTARTSRPPRHWHTLFPLSCRHNSQA